MGLSRLDETVERLLEKEIEDAVRGRKQIPDWLKASLERIYSGHSKSVDARIFVLKTLRGDQDVDGTIQKQ